MFDANLNVAQGLIGVQHGRNRNRDRLQLDDEPCSLAVNDDRRGWLRAAMNERPARRPNAALGHLVYRASRRCGAARRPDWTFRRAQRASPWRDPPRNHNAKRLLSPIGAKLPLRLAGAGPLLAAIERGAALNGSAGLNDRDPNACRVCKRHPSGSLACSTLFLHPSCLICDVHMPGFSGVERQANRSDEVIATALEPSRSVANTKQLGSCAHKETRGNKKKRQV